VAARVEHDAVGMQSSGELFRVDFVKGGRRAVAGAGRVIELNPNVRRRSCRHLDLAKRHVTNAGELQLFTGDRLRQRGV
jgi:hypothetical protein